MEEIRDRSMHREVRTLLSFATSEERVEGEYDLYIQSANRRLFGFTAGVDLIGCIGVEFLDGNRCEVKHIAVMPEYRGKGIGNRMVDYITNLSSCSCITAETDRDAVLFYKKIGFEILSLGEKYVGVDRFRCVRFMEG
ncbi:GNAT family N-acetyltransferase [Rossellomorea sp. YZS02]|uniref:GNAT family N-acetyltransferase n=1 Tax=Rossellomorea sp. YZS02 TaxID=3097358 RepID=UPI002A0D83C1|nr:GNAT family N-acetyltransferase [Rossellomorea sp. YZS02]MDX8342132.1 GNAT family N-acetyltransferase [Rossellomorea sp. YZS02]